MAKLYFNYSAMNAGKSTILLQASHNYVERGMRTLLLTARIDTRAGKGKINSRIGLKAGALTFGEGDDLYALVEAEAGAGAFGCVLVDEAQFLTPEQVWQLAAVADRLGVPVLTYGLRTDFRGRLFPGSATLLAIADNIREIRTICWCGRKATMVIRLDSAGEAQLDGEQIEIGGNDRYVSLCRKHWCDKNIGDKDGGDKKA